MPDKLPFRTRTFFGPALAGALLAGVVGYPGLSRAINIEFDYRFDTNGFFSDVNRRNILDAAAGFFETFLTDNLTAIDSGNGGTFNARVFNPSGDGSVQVDDFSVAADTLVIFAGAHVINGSTIAQGGPGGFSASGSTAFLDNAASRGQGDGTSASVRGASAFEFAPWGGAISFDTSSTWYFDTDLSNIESFSGNDFFSVALHELGHVLGFGISDSWNNLIADGDFTGVNSRAANGGSNVDLTSDGAHWVQSIMSVIFGTSTAQEAAMDPNITNGTRKRFTTLDMAGLEDIGWTVASASAQ